MESNQAITVSNGLVRAVQRLSLPEKRLLMLAVSKIDNGAGIGQIVEVSGVEYSDFYGLQKSPSYKALKAAEKKLWNRELLVPEITGDMSIRWIISYKYDSGSVSLRFHPDLDGHVTNLKERFTRYLLSRAADFKHLYTWRLFELVMQFKRTGKLVIKVDDFKRVMEIPEAYHGDFGLIRSKVINPSIKEIKEKDGMPITYEVTKKGRKVIGLEFTFPVEQQTAIALTTKPASKPPLSTAQAARNEQAAAMAHYRKMAEMANVPLETILPKHLKETETAD